MFKQRTLPEKQEQPQENGKTLQETVGLKAAPAGGGREPWILCRCLWLFQPLLLEVRSGAGDPPDPSRVRALQYLAAVEAPLQALAQGARQGGQGNKNKRPYMRVRLSYLFISVGVATAQSHRDTERIVTTWNI